MKTDSCKAQPLERKPLHAKCSEGQISLLLDLKKALVKCPQPSSPHEFLVTFLMTHLDPSTSRPSAVSEGVSGAPFSRCSNHYIYLFLGFQCSRNRVPMVYSFILHELIQQQQSNAPFKALHSLHRLTALLLEVLKRNCYCPKVLYCYVCIYLFQGRSSERRVWHRRRPQPKTAQVLAAACLCYEGLKYLVVFI